MTKQEVKDELKQTLGDPKVKARIRGLQMEMAQRRMKETVPEAEEVITNPTRLNRVVNSRIDGKADKSSGLKVYIEAKRIISANVILNEISRSNSIEGSGIIIKARIATTAIAMKRSLFLVIIGSFPPS